MTGRHAIQASLTATKRLLHMHLGDFSDADLLVRPVPGANHAAWQIGNVIAGDVLLVKEELPDAGFPDLPTGFLPLHGPEGAKQEGTDGFLTKAEYLKLFDEVRDTTIAAVEKLSDADLDRPVQGQMKAFAPTLGDLFLLVSHHTLLHVGQFTVIRRKLGKPVLF